MAKFVLIKLGMMIDATELATVWYEFELLDFESSSLLYEKVKFSSLIFIQIFAVVWMTFDVLPWCHFVEA